MGDGDRSHKGDKETPQCGAHGDQGHKQLNKKDQERHQIGKGIGGKCFT